MQNFSEIKNENIHDSIVINQVNQILPKSYEYNDLLDRLKEKQEFFDLQPEEKIERRLKISGEINQLQDFIEQFKRDVLQLAQAFQNIEINTDRLRRAKEFFDKGEFGEARAVFEMELEQMQLEQAQLLEAKKHYESETLPKLKHNSEEFYILALSTQSDYTNPNRYEDTCRYFEISIKSEATKDNLFRYAYFLDEHRQFPNAINYYNQYLDKFGSEISFEERATTLNNLANLHNKQNKHEKASEEYEEALVIYRQLAKENPNAYLPAVSATLNNLAALHVNQNEYKKAATEYEEALANRRELAKTNPNVYLPDVALTLNNLANLHNNQNEHEKASEKYEEALAIRRKFAKTNPNAYLPYVATTLNNLAVLHDNQKEYEKASEEYEEALAIRRELAKENPNAYLPYFATTLNNLAGFHADQNKYEKASAEFEEALAIRRELYKRMSNAYAPNLTMTLVNLAIFYQENLPEREKSLEYVVEAVILLRPIVETVPFTQKYLQAAMRILRNWELSDEEIERMIAEKMKSMEKNDT